MFKIISDGGCDFTKEEAKAFDVQVIPFYITFDGETFLREGIDITKEEYFEKLINDKNLYPKTSQPNPNDYMELYRPHLEAGYDILSMTISSKLSGSHNSASIAIDNLSEEYPERTIKLIDSKNASLGQGNILKEVCKMRDAGLSLEKTVAVTEKIISTTRTYFTLDTLEYLKKGGRVGPTTALVGGILGLRPILQLENGEISQLDSVRGKKKAMRTIEEGVIAVLKKAIQDVNVAIAQIRNEEEAKLFKSNLEKGLNCTLENPIGDIGAAIGTHAGPGVIAFTYCRKYETILAAEELEARKTA